ncbi:unnamed protein product [Chironomus riparius]|uniref:Mitochondrial nucleoid factor 1 n=1 Tax=Chironomus riparius TaxID=315576 RepID=A0A9N9WY47_9DIPT|nr:unnamed protein product [Chironomus riparius]
MSQNYKRFLAILEKWPVDKSKNNRDLGYFLREKFTTQFSGAQIVSTKDQKHIEKQFEALDNLVKNVHHEKYPRKFTSTSTGLTGEQCKQVLSSEFLEYINAEN